MSRPIVLHICLAFCSLVVLQLASQCLAFPKMGKRDRAYTHAEEGQTVRMNTNDQENTSISPKHLSQLMPSPNPMIASAGPLLLFPTDKEVDPPGAGRLQPHSPGLSTAIEPAIPTGDHVLGSSQPDWTLPESRLSKAVLTTAIMVPASLNMDEKEELAGSTGAQAVAEGTTEATQGILKYVDNPMFATKSQEGVSWGHSTSPYLNTKEMLATSPKTETLEAGPGQRATSFPITQSTADPELISILLNKEKAAQMTADNTQATATKNLLATSESTLSVEPEIDRLLGAPGATVSVSTAVPAVLSDEWDDTKLQSVGQIRAPQLGDNTETGLRIEPSQVEPVSQASVEGNQPSTEVVQEALGLSKEETHVGTALSTAQGNEPSPAVTHPSFFTPTSLTEDTEVSVVSLFESFTDSTKENSAVIFPESTVSFSEYVSEAYQPLKDIITEEMTTSVEDPEATLPLVTEEQMATLEVTRDSGEPAEGKEPLSPVLDAAGTTQPSRGWEPLATTASTTAIPLSFEVATAAEDLMDTITGPNEFIPVLGSPETPTGIMEEMRSISPGLPASELPFERTVPSISHANTAASYGLDQLDSEEGEEDEDEEDEEDEEEEEDDEEDEEDKDADSLDDSFDGDTELPGFTPPGLTSREPGLEQGNIDPLGAATYQVPDVIEWEQQNQGLVRSWMEKLKDKAGYMSGMLVPVGVGIAGALFILGALYSIKVMNRQRNGFKRHKRKQREFNSMQDRVMLLADSSEDEF
ncbi:LOW QUALITY PROTEIN: armadillo-like helical domain-containing protein 4 [Thomomys bottae]